jgi:hypothetical protein
MAIEILNNTSTFPDIKVSLTTLSKISRFWSNRDSRKCGFDQIRQCLSNAVEPSRAWYYGICCRKNPDFFPNNIIFIIFFRFSYYHLQFIIWCQSNKSILEVWEFLFFLQNCRQRFARHFLRGKACKIDLVNCPESSLQTKI